MSRPFYKTRAWKECRRTYFKAHTLCEECLSKGLIVPGEIVHHRIHITDDADESILLNWDNLQTLCRKCHAAQHPEMYGTQKRYSVNEWGQVSPR